MIGVFTSVAVDDKGYWPIVVGHPNFHISDWRGPNFKYVNLPGWPRGKRVNSKMAVEALLDTVDKDELRKLTERMTGAHCPDTMVA
jgi:hypothetical protein